MVFLPKPTDYTDRDFDSLKVRLYALVASVFPEWTDQNIANFGNLLVELFCNVGDVLGFYQDNQALESRLVTATQRRSLLGLVKLLSFKPTTAAAATVDVVLALPAALPGVVLIPPGAFVSTPEVVSPIRFQLLTPAVFPPGTTSVTASVENSQNQEDVFTSTGQPNQRLVLSQTPYLDNSAVVVAADGTYTEVPNLLSSKAIDKNFSVAVDQNDRARLVFGNGTNGAIPQGTVTVGYKTGGGSLGNVAPTLISKVEDAFTDSLGNPARVTVTNPLRASGGLERMSNAQIQVQAPAQIRAPVNSVAREDFVINTLRLASVARALFLTKNQDPSVPENTGTLYIIPQGGGSSSAALKALVLYQVTVAYPCQTTFKVNVLDAPLQVINISAQVYKQPKYSPSALRANIVAALGAYFAVSNADGTPNELVDFGGNMVDADGNPSPIFAWTDILDIVREAPGVRKIDPGPFGFLLNGKRGDVTVQLNQFPVLGTVQLIDADTGVVF